MSTNAQLEERQSARAAFKRQLTDLRQGRTWRIGRLLEYLKGLPTLQSLDLTGNNIIEAGIRGLQETLPNCTITQALRLLVSPIST